MDGSNNGISPAGQSVVINNGVVVVNTRQLIPEQRIPIPAPSFANLTDDSQLLENCLRFTKYCDQHNVPIPQMAQSLARAIGLQNGGRYNVLIHEYTLALPHYPFTPGSGRLSPLNEDGRLCNMIYYKDYMFGVIVFPASNNTTFYFPEFSSYGSYVQRLVYTFGNKTLRFCPEINALAFDFKPEPPKQPILLTATLTKKLDEEIILLGNGSGAVQRRIDEHGNIEIVKLE